MEGINTWDKLPKYIKLSIEDFLVIYAASAERIINWIIKMVTRIVVARIDQLPLRGIPDNQPVLLLVKPLSKPLWADPGKQYNNDKK